MSDEAPFLETSPWLVMPADPQPALSSDVTADVLVVGGGYTGLSTALSLRAAGADVPPAAYCFQILS